MKASWRGLMFAAFLAAGGGPMLLPVWFAGFATAHTAPAVAKGGASNMPAHVDEHSSLRPALGQMKLISKTAGPIALGADPVRISLAGAGSSENNSIASSLDKLEPGRRIYVVLKNLSTTEQPGVLYHLYLDLPAGARPAKNDPRYVGALNFFDVATPGSPRSDSFRSYDITDIARGLRARNLLSDRPTITISPAGAPAAEAKPMIGGVELVEQ